MSTNYPTSLDTLTNPAATDAHRACRSTRMQTTLSRHCRPNSAPPVQRRCYQQALWLVKPPVLVSKLTRQHLHGGGVTLPLRLLRGSGANDPTFAAYTGTNFYAHQFSATVMQQVYLQVHVPHDYVPGTDIYFHVHWSNAAATPNTGNVIWGFEYSYAKGHQQSCVPCIVYCHCDTGVQRNSLSPPHCRNSSRDRLWS